MQQVTQLKPTACGMLAVADSEELAGNLIAIGDSESKVHHEFLAMPDNRLSTWQNTPSARNFWAITISTSGSAHESDIYSTQCSDLTPRRYPVHP